MCGSPPIVLVKQFIIVFTFILFCTAHSLPLGAGTTNIMNNEKTFRQDGRCGVNYLAPNGQPAQCNSQVFGSCCSSSFWCGNSLQHCDCVDCINYGSKSPPESWEETKEEETPSSSQTPLDQLTALLEAVAGDSVTYEHGDKTVDSFSATRSPPPALVVPKNHQDDQPAKRMLPQIIATGLPFLTDFAGGLIKNALSQVINRPDPILYTQGILKRFVPRALAASNLKNTAVSSSIQTQFKNHNFNSAISTLDSNSHPIKTENHISNKFHKVLNSSTDDKKLVAAVKHILKAVASTLDSIISQRLTSVSNLLTSLFTSIVESLRLLLIELHEGHTRDLKKLLVIANSSLAEIKRSKPHTHIELYALLSAILTLLCLIFPALNILKNSVFNHANKLACNKYNKYEFAAPRTTKKKERTQIEDDGGFTEQQGATGGFKQPVAVSANRVRFTQLAQGQNDM